MIELLISTSEVCEMVTISPTDSALKIRERFRPDMLGSGVSRNVYKLSDALVLKIGNNCSGYGIHDNANANEIALWEALSEEDKETGTFAKIFAYAEDGSWIISELIPNIGEGWSNRSADNLRLIREYDVSDLHGDNYGTRHDGSFAILDYGANSEGCEGSAYREPCECFACSCQRCHPEGCECEPFEGCNYHQYRCQICSAAADAADRLAHCADLPTIARNKARNVARDFRGNYANQTAHVLWSGDTSEESGVKVCADCADEQNERRRLAEGPDPDMAQGILNFDNRYVIGHEIRKVWIPRGGLQTRIFWFVRDRFILDNVGSLERRHYGRPICLGVRDHEGYSEMVNICADLNNGLHVGNAAKIARL